MELMIGGETEGVTLVVEDNARPDREGWFNAGVTIRVGAWSGRYAAHFQRDDLASFAKGLREMAESGSLAELSSTDGYLDVRLARDHLGHISVTGEAWDKPRWGAHLVFAFDIDQTYVRSMRVSAEAILASFR
jgi:hypothetical protein